jgi:hypothetical protein
MKPKEPKRPRGRPRDVVKTVKPIQLAECPAEFVMQIQKQAEGLHKGCVEHSQPLNCAVALWRIAQGMSMRRVHRETGIDYGVIRQLVVRHQLTLADQKAKFATIYAQAASEYTELLFEKADRMREDPSQLDSISPDRLALTVGIMTDQAAKLSGMASTIIEHRKGASIADASEMIAAAKARVAEKLRNQAIEAEIIHA